MLTKNLRVALVHDWLWTFRGGEKLLEVLVESFPQAEIFTLFHREGKISRAIEKLPIHTSFLDRFPGVHRYYRYLLPLFPTAIEQFDFTGFDLIISTSHCVAKGIVPPPGAKHVCLCFTTMRYAWDQNREYFGKGWKRALVAPFLNYLRMWDVTSSARVDQFLAISRFVAKRIEKYYRRASEVVYPFVDLERFQTGKGEKGDYYLLVSAFAPYKRVELAIEACQNLGRRLLVVGDGQDAHKLRRIVGQGTELLGNLPDEELPDLYQGARALLFPGTEDFGITPLEAMACGTPVIAYRAGGVMETVVDGETGVFFSEPTTLGLAEGILDFEKRESSLTAEKCRARAESFSRAKFQSEILAAVESALGSSPQEKRLPPSPRPGLYLDT